MLLVLVIFLGAGFGGSFVGGVIYGQTLAENADDELSPRLGAGSQFGGGGQGAGSGQRGQGRQGQDGGFAGAQGGGNRGSGEAEAARQGVGPGGAGQGRPRQGGGPVGAGSQGQDGLATAQESGSPTSDAEARAEGQQAVEQTPNRQRGGPGQGSQAVRADSSAREGRAEPAADSAETGTRETVGAAAEERAGASPPGTTGRGGALGTVKALEDEMMTIASARGDLVVSLNGDTSIYQVKEAAPEALTEKATVRVNGSRNPEGGITAQAVVILPEGAENLFGAGGGPGGRTRGQ